MCLAVSHLVDGIHDLLLGLRDGVTVLQAHGDRLAVVTLKTARQLLVCYLRFTSYNEKQPRRKYIQLKYLKLFHCS